MGTPDGVRGVLDVPGLRGAFGVRGLSLGAVLGTLGGCAGVPSTRSAAGAAAWVFVLLLVAAGAGAIGALLARRGAERALRAAASQARELAALQAETTWLWQTDARHALLSWRGPGTVSPDEAGLFADPVLLARMRTQMAFAGLRVALAQPLAGSFGWQLNGVPRHDDAGAFAGFHGSARPTDAADAEHAASRAMDSVLATHTGPALLAVAVPGGWRVQAHNPAALTLWPGVDRGTALLTLVATLPPGVRSAVDQAIAGSTARAEADGWAVLPCGGVDARSLLLLRPPAAAAHADAGASSHETDQFSFTVSHDLRAPIRVVEGFTRIVKEDYGKLLDRVGNDHLDRVLGAATRMNLMIDALLTLARLSSQPLARQPVNLSQLAGYVVDDLRRSSPERNVDVDIEPGLTAQGDPTLLRMVLENLLGNAWKYSARASPRAQISLRSVPHGAGLAYVVRDNGAGFDMRSAERLFGLFQRLHSASEFAGHGVGLASVRRIVRRHGGDVWADAEPGKGAAFYFTLSSA